jgi:hypothetical protein
VNPVQRVRVIGVPPAVDDEDVPFGVDPVVEPFDDVPPEHPASTSAAAVPATAIAANLLCLICDPP